MSFYTALPYTRQSFDEAEDKKADCNPLTVFDRGSFQFYSESQGENLPPVLETTCPVVSEPGQTSVCYLHAILNPF